MSSKKDSIDQLLASIKPTKAPAFLLTRISTRLKENDLQPIGTKWFLAGALCLLLLITINYYGLSRYVYSASDLADFAQNMELLDSETLY